MAEVKEMMLHNPNELDRHRLEQVRGFLNYVAQACPGLTPYLNGFHLTIDGWRENRDDGGWRVRNVR